MQDYLKNPMFDSLHTHRRYWPPGLVDRRGGGGATITLRPLGAITKKGMMNGKFYPGGGGGGGLGMRNCKVL